MNTNQEVTMDVMQASGTRVHDSVSPKPSTEAQVLAQQQTEQTHVTLSELDARYNEAVDDVGALEHALMAARRRAGLLQAALDWAQHADEPVEVRG